jgi:hypothetical protein
VGALGLVLVSGAAFAEAAHPPSYYENPADKIIPADGPPEFGSWRGKAIWYAEGECGAYYRNFSKNEDAENLADGFDQSAFTRLLEDRKMKPDDVASLIIEAEHGPMKDRMEVVSISQGSGAIERRCDALGRAYVEGW